jgi:hypothetical protein
MYCIYLQHSPTYCKNLVPNVESNFAYLAQHVRCHFSPRMGRGRTCPTEVVFYWQLFLFRSFSNITQFEMSRKQLIFRKRGTSIHVFPEKSTCSHFRFFFFNYRVLNFHLINLHRLVLMMVVMMMMMMMIVKQFHTRSPQSVILLLAVDIALCYSLRQCVPYFL